jgi:hypothetical protein
MRGKDRVHKKEATGCFEIYCSLSQAWQSRHTILQAKSSYLKILKFKIEKSTFQLRKRYLSSI